MDVECGSAGRLVPGLLFEFRPSIPPLTNSTQPQARPPDSLGSFFFPTAASILEETTPCAWAVWLGEAEACRPCNLGGERLEAGWVLLFA